ncbi:hypothetical protein ACLOJK_019558 [Asimina triloba]
MILYHIYHSFGFFLGLLAATGLGLSVSAAETHLPIVFLASVTGNRDAPPDRLPRLRRKQQRRTSRSSSSPPSQAAEMHLPIIFLASVAGSRDAPPDRLPRLRRKQQRRTFRSSSSPSSQAAEEAEGCHFSLSSPRLQSTEKNPNLPLLFSLSSLSSSRGRNSPHLKVTGSRNTKEIRKQPPIPAQGHCEMRGWGRTTCPRKSEPAPRTQLASSTQATHHVGPTGMWSGPGHA